MLYNTVDREKIEHLVRDFYAEVLKDKTLGPIFIKSLGSDLKGGKWHEHLHVLASFWMLMMTGRPGYPGDPFPPHAFLGPLTRAMFEQWLKLFRVAIDDLFIQEIADKFYKKADVLAEQFMNNLGVDDDDDD